MMPFSSARFLRAGPTDIYLQVNTAKAKKVWKRNKSTFMSCGNVKVYSPVWNPTKPQMTENEL